MYALEERECNHAKYFLFDSLNEMIEFIQKDKNKLYKKYFLMEIYDIPGYKNLRISRGINIDGSIRGNAAAIRKGFRFIANVSLDDFDSYRSGKLKYIDKTELCFNECL